MSRGLGPLDSMTVVNNARSPLTHPLVLALIEHLVKLLIIKLDGRLPPKACPCCATFHRGAPSWMLLRSPRFTSLPLVRIPSASWSLHKKCRSSRSLLSWSDHMEAWCLSDVLWNIAIPVERSLGVTRPLVPQSYWAPLLDLGVPRVSSRSFLLPSAFH